MPIKKQAAATILNGNVSAGVQSSCRKLLYTNLYDRGCKGTTKHKCPELRSRIHEAQRQCRGCHAGLKPTRPASTALGSPPVTTAVPIPITEPITADAAASGLYTNNAAVTRKPVNAFSTE